MARLTPYVLTFFIFTVYQGHGLALDSYRDYMTVVLPSQEACETLGKQMMAGWHSQPDLKTLSRDIGTYQCEALSDQAPHR